MSRPLTRARVALVASGAFLGGLLVAAGFNLTPFGYAQQGGAAGANRTTAQEVKPLTDAGNAFAAIAERVTPAVVSIQTTQDARPQQQRRRPQAVPPGLEDFFDQFDPQRRMPAEGSGSGFIVSRDGYILTNNHVVDDADRVKVALQDRRVFDAKVVGRDPSTDLAVIKIEGRDLPTAALGNDEQARVGEWVLAVGNPLALDFTVTAGIISAKHRSSASLQRLFPTQYAIIDYIQTDAAINPGNSGGPLVNTRGEVIGINSAIASPTGAYAGYGFAIPVSLAKQVMDDLIKYGKVRRAILGVSINDVTPEDAQSAGLKEIRGAIVQGFNPPDGSPAKRAGLEPGDVIVAIDGQTVDRVSELQRIIRGRKPGDNVKVDVMRFGDRRSFTVRLTEAEAEERVASADRERESARPEPTFDKLGLSIRPLSEADARQARLSEEQRGIVVSDVDPRSSAYERNLTPGTVILEVLHPQRKRVRSVQDLEGVVSGMRDGDVITLLVYNLRDETRTTRVVSIRAGD
jgi:serine protease Do